MKTLIAALALCALVATPAFAHVHGSHVGAGKVASSKCKHAHVRKAGHRAFARVAPRKPQSTSPYAAYGAVTPFGSPTAGNAQTADGGAREAAIHECSVMSRKYLETTWATMQMHQYRSCMMQHGQPE